MTTHVEHEVTLAICSEAPDTLGTEIAGLKEIAHCDLTPLPSRHIEDIYVDTADGTLRRLGWALRLRRSAGIWTITLKGPSAVVAWGGVERLELELPWSREAALQIFEELSSRGLLPGESHRSTDIDDPLATLAAAGLRIIQQRETCREPRAVRCEGQTVAELVVDRVLFHVGDVQVIHVELEIEARGSEDVAKTQLVAQALQAAYGTRVRVWNHGKLATGMAITHLLDREGSEWLLASDGHLQPAAYDALGAILSQGTIAPNA